MHAGFRSFGISTDVNANTFCQMAEIQQFYEPLSNSFGAAIS